MKRVDLIRHLKRNGCKQIREGSNHSWWYNPKLDKRSALPRHREIVDILAKKICIDLGVPPIK